MVVDRTFLLVEDSDDDVKLFRRSFIKARLMNTLQVVQTAEEAIAYLTGTGKFSDRTRHPLPSIVFLDLQLPGMSGFEVLKVLRRDTSLNKIRAIVLTGSDNMRDVKAAYELGANSFLIKPADFDRFVEFSQALGGYWTWSDAPSTPASAPPMTMPSRRTLN
jgi:CheY-like chemotaxis protein